MPEYLPEKLQIFVSSTIRECAAERKIAKRAIESLNHQPILFEHLGARSAPPRDVYIRKLDQCHIFIGIYRHSYGWVAPGATISGIDDELRRSGRRGMPRLVYIFEEDDGRDERLRALLSTVENTFWRFRNSEELYDRIRQDVEAEVAKRFHEAERLEGIVKADAATSISGLVPEPPHLLQRLSLSEELIRTLSLQGVLQVSGELGIGKTVFLASVARERNFLFVSATQLDRHELASVLSNKLNSLTGGEPRYFTDASAAFSALRDSWRATEEFTLIVDDCPDPEFVAALLKNVGGASSQRRLIYSIRNADLRYGHPSLVIPALSVEEVRAFLSSHGLNFSGEALQTIYERSGGNPLYLLYFSQAPSAAGGKSLLEYELDAWRKLPPIARELGCYLAIANDRLPFADLLALAGRGAHIEEVSDAIREAHVFITELPNGYALRHEHQRTTIMAQVHESDGKFAYYSRRVAGLLIGRRNYIRAFFILRETDGAAALKISRSALFDAQRRGDFGAQLSILEHIFEAARSSPIDPEDLVMLLLSEAQALLYTGQGSRVNDVLTEAETAAAKSGTPSLELRVREARAILAATTSLRIEDFDAIQRLEGEYLAAGDLWSSARMASELSALLIRAKRYSEALAPSERGLKIFQDLEDEYGISVCKRNKASALLETLGREDEGVALIEEFERQQDRSGTQRERAWLCNYMVRVLRRKKEFAEALKYGKEAVHIGQQLSDLYVVGTNRVCVGNVYRDMGDLNAALREYLAAGDAAQKVQHKSLESSACRLAAGIYRRQNNNRLGLQHARMAVNLIQETFATAELADALEEVGDCQSGSRNWTEAAEAYAKAAAASTDLEEKSRLEVEALSVCVDEGLGGPQYIACLDLGNGKRGPTDCSLTEQLFRRMGDILKTVHINYALRLWGLHFRKMFGELPQPVSRFLYRKVLKEIVGQTKSTDVWRLLFAAIPLTTGASEWHLSLPDVVDLGDALQERVAGLHFKPLGDGALWVIALDLRQSIILTITCQDTRMETFTAAALLALFFKGFERSIAEIIGVPESRVTS
jgi:tetratricopeptide (TPR) repeat protein